MPESKLLNTQAQLSLTEALRRGDLRSGQFLSMPQLVGILGYPLAAVREAVRHAGASGWLNIIPKRGVQVLEAHPDTIRDTLDARMVLDQEGARRRIASRQPVPGGGISISESTRSATPSKSSSRLETWR